MRNDFCDLHVHTTASDGLYSPERLVEEACLGGLAAVAITDHDTVDGVRPALEAAQGLTPSLVVVPGLELGTDFNGVEVHLLGYFLDIDNVNLSREMERLRRSRLTRCELMVRRLRELGYRLRPEDIGARGRSVGRPHIAEALVKAGYVGDVGQAFAELLGRGRPAYIPRFKHSPSKALELIRAAGGVAVLAHPGLYPAASAEILPFLVAEGLGGLEVYYPAHDDSTQTYYLDLCDRFQLVATGGSDFHGPGRHGDAQLGSSGVPLTSLEKLKGARATIGAPSAG